MRVDGTGPGSVERSRDSGRSEEVGSGHKRHRSKESDGEGGDKVAISTRARDVAKAREAAGSASDVDEAKVAKLRAAIQSGAYNVDNDKVADRLVEEHLHTLF